MKSPITLLTSQAAFDQFFLKLDWHDAFVKESHFCAATWRVEGGTRQGEEHILRVLFVFPSESPNQALEIVAFNVTNFSLAEFLDDNLPRAEIRRRDAHFAVGPFVRVNCSSLGYRWRDKSVAGNKQVFSKDNIFHDTGEILEPYNIDWRTEMDLALL